MKFTLTLDDKQLNTIAAALNELPRKLSQPVFEAIENQLLAQRAAAEAAKVPIGSPIPDTPATVEVNGHAEGQQS